MWKLVGLGVGAFVLLAFREVLQHSRDPGKSEREWQAHLAAAEKG